MRRYNAVFRLQQRIIAFNRLCGHDIDRCGIDLSGVECVSEVFLDDKAAAALEYIRNYPGITFEEVNG